MNNRSGSADSQEKPGQAEEKAAYEKARNAKSGSITAKANLVRDFDERNKKK